MLTNLKPYCKSLKDTQKDNPFATVLRYATTCLLKEFLTYIDK